MEHDIWSTYQSDKSGQNHRKSIVSRGRIPVTRYKPFRFQDKKGVDKSSMIVQLELAQGLEKQHKAYARWAAHAIARLWTARPVDWRNTMLCNEKYFTQLIGQYYVHKNWVAYTKKVVLERVVKRMKQERER